MDMMAMVSSMLAMKAAGTQQQIQTSIIKQNADAEKSAVQTLLGTPSTANLGAGIGGNLERYGLVASALDHSGATPSCVETRYGSQMRSTGFARRRAPRNAAFAGCIAALISLTASSLAHSAGPARLAISQPWPSTSTEVGIPSAFPTLLRS